MISAETLLGADERPAELKRWLRVRDVTCRFPGCRTNAVVSEIDHTRPWAQGGLTDHDNLAHLCRRHHMFKSKGFWKARQTVPGVIEWTSPGGRTYRTEPHLSLTTDGKVSLQPTPTLPRMPYRKVSDPMKPSARAAYEPTPDSIPGSAPRSGSATGPGSGPGTDMCTASGADPDGHGYGADPPPF